MSLINDALKKAQRLRSEPVPPGEALPGGGGRVMKRGQPMRAQSVILLFAAAASLIVLSAVVTVYLINRPSAPVHLVAAKLTAAPSDAPAPNIVVPISALAPAVEKAAPLTPASSAPVTSGSLPSNPVSAVPEPASPDLSAGATLAPSPVATSTVAHATRPKAPDAHIQTFVDSVRVTGIRSSGDESKVIMNDRVYRVNDLVERTLGVKLLKVEADQLTFIDAAGFTYTKHF